MNIKTWFFTLLFITVVIGGVFYVKKDIFMPSQAAQQPGFEPAATVQSITLSSTAYQGDAQVNGEIKAPQALLLKNELAGKITELNLPSGRVVNKGDLLLKLDISNESASLVAAKAKLTLSEQTIERYKKLVKRDEISADAFDRAEADLAIAQAEVMLLESSINKKTLTAPFKAVVGLHNLAEGQFLDKNTAIVDLVGVDKYSWLEFSLPQSFPELSIKQQVIMQSLNAEQNLNAKIIAVNPVMSANSRHLKYRAQYVTRDFTAKPNTLVNVIVPIAKALEVIAVPDIALIHDQFGDYVYMLIAGKEGSYRAKRTQVEVEGKEQGQVLINKGLTVGDVIATHGAFKLRDGMKVYVDQADKTETKADAKAVNSQNH